MKQNNPKQKEKEIILTFLEVVKADFHQPFTWDRRIKADYYVAEYRGSDGEYYRKTYWIDEDKNYPNIIKQGTHKEINNALIQIKGHSKNPSQSQITRCRKVLSEAKRETEKPTISHYRDMNNGIAKNHLIFLKRELTDLTRKLKQAQKLGHSKEYISNVKDAIREVKADIVSTSKSARLERNPQTKTSVKNPNPLASIIADDKRKLARLEAQLKATKRNETAKREQLKTAIAMVKESLRFYSKNGASVANPNNYARGKWHKENDIYYYEVLGTLPANSKRGLKAGMVRKVNNSYRANFIGVWTKDFSTLTEAKQAIEKAQYNAATKTANSVKRVNPKKVKPLIDWKKEHKFSLDLAIDLLRSNGWNIKDAGRNDWNVTNRQGKKAIMNDNEIIYHATKLAKGNPKLTKKPNFASKEFNVSKTLDKHSKMFQGQVTRELRNVAASDFAADNLFRLGKLKMVKVQNGKDAYELEFDAGDEAFLAGDIRKNLHFVGKSARLPNNCRPKSDVLEPLGKMTQVDYITAKNHIGGGKTIHFYHESGEVDGITPTICVDKNGFLVLLNDGNYDIWKEGIVN